MKLEVISQEPESKPRPTPILFVHGALHAAWCWEEHFMPYFASKGYRTYAMSLRGHGKSEGGDLLRWTSINEFADDLAQVVGEIEESPILVGHSMGGLVVQKHLELSSAPAAVLMTPIPLHGLLPFLVRYGQKHLLTLIRSYATLNFYYAVRRPDLSQEMFWSADMPEELVNKYHSLLDHESARAVIDMQFTTFAHPRKIKDMPVLVMGVAEDAFFQVQEIEHTARTYGTSAVIFQDMAHDMMLDKGWEEVADTIIIWLQELGL